MSIIVQREGTIKGNCHQIGRLWTNQSFPSMSSSEGKSDKQSMVIRASTPSKYLRRTGPIPNGIDLKINTRYKTSILSSSSSMVTSPSWPPPDSNIGCKSSTIQPDTSSLPSLTESNLAGFMEQLRLSDLPHPDNYTLNPTSAIAIEISYFSDGSSIHPGSDFE